MAIVMGPIDQIVVFVVVPRICIVERERIEWPWQSMSDVFAKAMRRNVLKCSFTT
jgi:hypothetical protein